MRGLRSYASAEGIPRAFDTTVRTITSGGSLETLEVDHWSGLNSLGTLFAYADNATSQIYAQAEGLGGSLVATFSARDFSVPGKPVPSVSVSSTFAGADLYGHVEGEPLGGGFIDVALEGLPRQLSTTFLADKPVRAFRIYAEDVGRVDISQRKLEVNPPPPFFCAACQHWSDRSLGYASLEHSDVLLLGLHLNRLWKAQECPAGNSESTCDLLGLWTDRYFTYDINTILHYPPYLASPNSEIRFARYAG